MSFKFPAFFIGRVTIGRREFSKFEIPDPMFHATVRFSRRGALVAAWRLLTRRVIVVSLECTDPALAREVYLPIARRLIAWNPADAPPADSVTQSPPDAPRTPR